MPYPCAIPGISLTDYSLTPLEKGWGNPCSAQLATVLLTEARVSVDIRIAELVGLIMRANEKQGYLYRKADTGAYNCRKISGSSRWSNHAWGLALDGNWQTNPYATVLRTDMPQWVIERWNRFGFAWGGHYSGRKDAMHKEFMGTPEEALSALLVARRELGDVQVPPPPPPPVKTVWHDVPWGAVSDLWGAGAQVRSDQGHLNNTGFYLPVDGYWGRTSVDRAQDFQRAAGIPADGEFGPASRGHIALVPAWRGGLAGGGYTALVWQTRLARRGWNIDRDGIWGPRSISILRQFQAEKRLAVTGARDAATWTALHCRPIT